jgi:hypothetical protein
MSTPIRARDTSSPGPCGIATLDGERAGTASVLGPGFGRARLRGRPSIVRMADVAWPSDNEYGVPTLDPALQAEVVERPVVRWGRERRVSRVRGTWHFYIDDERLEPLWSRPWSVLRSGAGACCEPNFSVTPDTPRAVALYQVYRKRLLARSWQAHGLRILVDLCVAAEHAEIALLGVPRGWRAYSTRARADHLDELEADAALAREHAGQEPLLLVVGGGMRAGEMCRRRGWIWIEEAKHG